LGVSPPPPLFLVGGVLIIGVYADKRVYRECRVVPPPFPFFLPPEQPSPFFRVSDSELLFFYSFTAQIPEKSREVLQLLPPFFLCCIGKGASLFPLILQRSGPATPRRPYILGVPLAFLPRNAGLRDPGYSFGGFPWLTLGGRIWRTPHGVALQNGQVVTKEVSRSLLLFPPKNSSEKRRFLFPKNRA